MQPRVTSWWSGFFFIWLFFKALPQILIYEYVAAEVKTPVLRPFVSQFYVTIHEPHHAKFGGSSGICADSLPNTHTHKHTPQLIKQHVHHQVIRLPLVPLSLTQGIPLHPPLPVALSITLLRRQRACWHCLIFDLCPLASRYSCHCGLRRPDGCVRHRERTRERQKEGGSACAGPLF